MKKTNILVFVILFLASAVFAEAKRPVVAVSTFEVKGGAIALYEADAIMELYTNALQQTRRVILVNRNIVDKTLKKMNFQEEDWLDSKKTKEVGNAVNAQFLTYGKIFGLGNKLYLSTWIVDASTANVVSEFSNFQFLLDGEADPMGYVLAQNAFVIDPGIKFVANVITQQILPYKYGGRGPGGGIINRFEDDMAIEISEPIAEVDCYHAASVCNSYRGGGYDDWYLPSTGYELVGSAFSNVMNLEGIDIWACNTSGGQISKLTIHNGTWSGAGARDGKAFVLAARKFKIY